MNNNNNNLTNNDDKREAEYMSCFLFDMKDAHKLFMNTECNICLNSFHKSHMSKCSMCTAIYCEECIYKLWEIGKRRVHFISHLCAVCQDGIVHPNYIKRYKQMDLYMKEMSKYFELSFREYYKYINVKKK